MNFWAWMPAGGVARLWDEELDKFVSDFYPADFKNCAEIKKSAFRKGHLHILYLLATSRLIVPINSFVLGKCWWIVLSHDLMTWASFLLPEKAMRILNIQTYQLVFMVFPRRGITWSKKLRISAKLLSSSIPKETSLQPPLLPIFLRRILKNIICCWRFVCC